jgi:hypothetical protein
MTRFRLERLVPAVLTLALFLGWLGVSAVHHHVDQPGCEICKAMHNGAADVPRPAHAGAPGHRAEPIAFLESQPIAQRSIPLHPSRAPPTA